MRTVQKASALAGLAALTLLDISAAAPVAAQGTNPFAGAYAGGHAGYFTGDAKFKSAPYSLTLGGDTFSIPGRNDSFDFDGFMGGAHGGINFTTLGNFLFGVEGDWTWLGDSDSVSASGAGTSGTGSNDGFAFQRRSEIDLEWQGTIRGRIGVVNGNTLFFATAGVGFLNVDWSETGRFTNTTSGPFVTAKHSDSDTLVGGVIGGGIEIAVTPVFIIGADYLYENFGSSDSLPHGFAPGQTGKIDDLEIHKVRARISIKFGGPPQ